MTTLALTGTEMDFAEARRLMLLGQLTPNAVSDPLLLQAMGEVERERFVPPAMQHRAYADEAVPLGNGRAMMAPMVLGRLIQMALPQPGERALVLGAGPGYGAAVLARMGLDVTAVESDASLLAAGRAAFGFALHAHRPALRHGDPALGAPEGAPFRLILTEGAVETVPAALWPQLGEGGRAVFVRADAGRVGRAVLLRRVGGTVTETVGFDAAAPLLPDFRAAPAFVF